jgi:hypothetical protein
MPSLKKDMKYLFQKEFNVKIVKFDFSYKELSFKDFYDYIYICVCFFFHPKTMDVVSSSINP